MRMPVVRKKTGLVTASYGAGVGLLVGMLVRALPARSAGPGSGS